MKRSKLPEIDPATGRPYRRTRGGGAIGRKCGVPNCGQKYYQHGLCKKHDALARSRQKTYGYSYEESVSKLLNPDYSVSNALVETNFDLGISQEEYFDSLFCKIKSLISSYIDDSDIVTWAESRFLLAPGDGVNGNRRLDFRLYPLSAEILRWFTDPVVRVLIIMMGTQNGKSVIVRIINAFAGNKHGFNGILIPPTDDLREKIPKTQLIPVYSQSNVGFVGMENDNKIIRWENGTFTWIASAQSQQSLVDTSGCSYSIHDECDEVRANLSYDAISAAYDRIRPRKMKAKQALFGTPKRTDEGGLQARGAKVMMHFPEMKCPSCNKYEIFDLENIKWPEDKDPDVIRESRLAWAECPSCGHHCRDFDHFQMAIGARMRCLTPTRHKSRKSARIPSWCGNQMSWSDVAFEYLIAKDDPIKLCEFMKSVACRATNPNMEETVTGVQPYETKKGLWSRDNKEIPADVRCITAGVDPGVNQFWCVVIGWGSRGRKYFLWSFEQQFEGPSLEDYKKAWREVFIKTRLPEHTIKSAARPKFMGGLVDSGDAGTAVYDLCAESSGWLPAKGDPALRALYGKGNIDPDNKHRGRWGALTLIRHNTHMLQDALERCLNTPISSPNGVEFAMDEGPRLFKHLRNVVRKRSPTGQVRWDKTSKSAADHLRDAAAHAMLAGIILECDTIPDYVPKKEQPIEPVDNPKEEISNRPVRKPARTRVEAFRDRNRSDRI